MRLLPYSAETESALLACAFFDRDAFAVAKGILKSTDFYLPANALAWSTCEVVFDRGEPIDYPTVRDALDRMGKLALVGGDEYLLGITSHIADTRSAESYARKIRDHARHRTLVQTHSAMAARGYDPDLSFEEYRTESERAIREVTTVEADGEPVHIGEVLNDVLQATHDVAKAGQGAITGHLTGIRKLDTHLTGLQPGTLVIPAGRPGMGKSAFTSGIVLSTKATAAMLAFSIEMPNRENGQRLLAAEVGMDLRDLALAKISRDEWGDIARTCERLKKLPIYIDEKTRTLEQIVSKSRRFKAKHGNIGPIIIDYLQLIRGDKRLPREQQISETTRELKALSKELQCPIVCLSQLNRECEKRPDKRPQMADLRESGAIEQDADVIIFLYRRGYYAAQMAKETKPRKPAKWEPECDIVPGEDDGITEFIIAKMRGGPTGTVRALFQNASARFVDLDERAERPVPRAEPSKADRVGRAGHDF